MKLIFEDKDYYQSNNRYGILEAIFFFIILIFILFSLKNQNGFEQLFWAAIVGIGIAICLIIILRNQLYGDDLLKIKTGLPKNKNKEFISRIAKTFKWDLRIDEGNQLRFVEKDEYQFMDYETTLLIFDDEIFFNYRAVRKGTIRKFLFRGNINKKKLNEFVPKFNQLKDEEFKS